MTAPPAVLKVGLTGGIASGKSTVAGFLRREGARVIDADLIAREATAPGGAAHDAVVERFGPDILDRDGRIDRARLAGLVFGDPSARRDLEAIVHPHVRERIARAIARGGEGVAVVEAALLVETGAWREYHRLIVVRCTPATQARRLRERDGLCERDARLRIEAQAPLEDKLAVADHVIDGEADLEVTRRRTAEVWTRLCDDLADLRAGRRLSAGPAGN